MAKRGRPPKKKNGDLKVINGNFKTGKGVKKSKLPADRGKHKLPSDAPDKPAWLGDIESEIWDRTIKELHKVGTLQKVDAGSLECYCDAYARKIRAKQQIQDDGGSEYYETEGRQGRMRRVHPAVQVIQESEKKIKSFATEFGMSPAARKNLGYDPRQGDLLADDPSQEYI